MVSFFKTYIYVTHTYVLVLYHLTLMKEKDGLLSKINDTLFGLQIFWDITNSYELVRNKHLSESWNF